MDRDKPVVLLIEDERMDAELALDAFREVQPECRIHVARNGDEALDYLLGRGAFANRNRYPLPHLVLLDLKLPGLSGIEVLRTVKQTPILRRLPVVVLTSSRQESDRAVCYEFGANSYLVKPLSYDGFVRLVRQVCEYWLVLNEEIPLTPLEQDLQAGGRE